MTTTGIACGSCDAALRQCARFCDACGSPVAASSDAAKYKQVTVLFADVVGSMDIAARVDVERLREIMTELVERSAAVVQRYGGTVEYNGDGVMALFGAPVALEDHAFRGCLAALAIQAEAASLAADVERRDGVALRLRVGLNSGRVIAGELGSGSLGYAATGTTVGFAQRMESAAPPGGVLLSESTAQLVERTATLGDPEWVRIKGTDDPVPARRLVALGPRDGMVGRADASLVGRRWEMAALDALAERAISGRGGVVNVVGPPGIGKSRVAREAAAMATRLGAKVFWVFCESHAREVPFYAVTGLLRASSGAADLDGDATRARLRAYVPADADPQDVLLLDDLLGVAHADVAPPQIDRDARRRRLTALVNTISMARTEPALFIIEDAHWIDAVSESMLADFFTVTARTPSMVLITSRPEYDGAFTRMHGAQTIALAPLGDSDTAALLSELLGSDPSVAALAAIIAGQAAGNPFFAEEMVRDLVQRAVLTGEQGAYVCGADVAGVAVPATVQAAIEARIDRLGPSARRTLEAASVIGARFGVELLAALGIDPVFDELLDAELVDQVRFTPRAEYAFHHPLVRAVAYESQLNSGRAQSHRRLAAAIEAREPGSADENAALVAEHLQAAGELRAAHDWHMRAAAWSTNRDLVAARLSWERARQIADAISADDPDQLSMRIAPRTMLCATDWQAREVQESGARFAELRELCGVTGDKVSLAIAMTGLAAELLYAGRAAEGAQLSSQQMALLESIDDPTPAMGLAAIAFCNWLGVFEFGEILRWSQNNVDLAAGDPTKGAGFGIGSPLAVALAWRGTTRWWLGSPGWRDDIHDAVAMAQRSNPETLSGTIAWSYGFAIQHGVLRADDSVVRASEDAVQNARRASSDRAVGLAAYTLGVALLCQDDPTDRRRGLEMMTQARAIWLRKRAVFLIPVTDVWSARETARRGDRDAAIPAMREAVGELRRGMPFYGAWGTGVLVETLLKRAADGDLAEAQEELERLATLRAAHDSAMLDIMLLRLRTLLAAARGEDVAHRDLAIRYLTMAESLGFEGHVEWAKAMAESGTRR